MRVCLLCKYFYIHHGSQSYSEQTPGSDWDCGCEKKKWVFDAHEGDTETYRRMLLTAKDCSEYLHHLKPDPNKPKEQPSKPRYFGLL
jgi:hypothetical protein